MAKVRRNRTTATTPQASKASDNGGLVCVANTSARLLTINLARSSKAGAILVNRVRLVPGNNLVDRSVWEEAEKLEFTRNHMAAGNISLAVNDVKRGKDVAKQVEEAADTAEESTDQDEE